TFEDVVGQKAVVQTLQNAIRANRVAQAYIFSGMRGVGKTTAARILAKALNCAQGPTPTPCNVCESCVGVNEDRALDVLEIDGASNRGIDDIRQLREAVRYKPIQSRYKVIIIDEVHQVTGPAFNALLKTLEEPPPSTVFIFATTEYQKVPATILSRCQHFEFRNIGQREMAEHLAMIAARERITISPAGLHLIADVSQGSLRDAESLLDQAVAFCGNEVGDEALKEILGLIDRRLLLEFSSAVIEGRPAALFPLVEAVIERGYDLRAFYKELIRHFRNLLLVRAIAEPSDLLPLGDEALAALRAEAEKTGVEDLLRYLTALQQGEAGLKFSSHPRIYFETAMVRLSQFQKLVPIGEMLEDLSRLKRELGVAGPGLEPEPARPAAAAASFPPRERIPAAEARRPAPPPPPDVPGREKESPPERSPAAARGTGSDRLRRARDLEAALKDPSFKTFDATFKAQVVAVEPMTKPDEED
ncbi:MAG: DNA polymerase III subunit gamma/tau, partial [Candidatus Aminicenantes bacterium]|nr:DNA polymerase III subunit gamma/tau [Candidatus Aminicenantes bacterium]